MWGRRFIFIVSISFLYLLALIPVVFDVRQNFMIELVFFGALLLFTILASAAVFNEQRWSWPLFTIVFALGLANLLWVYFFTTRIFLFAIAVILAVTGFVMSVLNIKDAELYEYKKYKDKVDTGKVSDEEVIVEEIKPLGKPEEPSLERRYLGSLKSTEYHEPKCLAAKRIVRKNQIWFSSVADAERQGYSAHSCVE
jgi:hypothetical protein